MTSSTNGGSTTGYGYDGDGRRVSKGGSKLYWYGSGGETLAETDTAGNLLNEYVYFVGRRWRNFHRQAPRCTMRRI